MNPLEPGDVRYAICIRNDDHPASLEARKIYPVLSDPAAAERGLLRIVDESGEDSLFSGADFLVLDSDAGIIGIRVTDEAIIAELAAGRTVSVPLAWSWRLSEATPEQRANWRIIGSGDGIHWPDVDEDIGVRGMLDGVPAHRPQSP